VERGAGGPLRPLPSGPRGALEGLEQRRNRCRAGRGAACLGFFLPRETPPMREPQGRRDRRPGVLTILDTLDIICLRLSGARPMRAVRASGRRDCSELIAEEDGDDDIPPTRRPRVTLADR
jgi:hypothetical protein